MEGNFRRYDQSQQLLLPLNLGDFVPCDHPARMINAVVDSLDITGIVGTYSVEGNPAYHPRMMLKVLLYAYTCGVYSSRDIEKMLWSDTAFMYLGGLQRPDYRTICRYRSEHLVDFKSVFEQVVRLCREMGLASLGTVSVDGTKIKANASRKKSWDEERVRKEIDEIVGRAVETDREEDEKYGDVNPHRLPESLNTREKRLKKLGEAKKRLEEQERVKKEKEEKTGQQKPKGSKGSNTTKTNITDPDSRLMKSRGAFFQGYNCQAVVDEECQVVVAAMVGNSPVDYDMLLPMLMETRRVNGVLPGRVLADAGYFSFDNLEKANILGVDAYIPDQMYHNKGGHDKDKPGGKTDEKKKKMYGKDMFNYDPVGDVYVCPSGRTLSFSHVSPNNGVDYRVYFCHDCMGCPRRKECTSAENRRVTRNPREHLWEAMRAKLGTVEGKKTYAKRMCTVEPVFGNIKKNHRFTEFSLRGLAKAGIEFLLACTVHNLGKMTLQKIKQILETIRTKTPSFKTSPYPQSTKTGINIIPA